MAEAQPPTPRRGHAGITIHQGRLKTASRAVLCAASYRLRPHPPLCRCHRHIVLTREAFSSHVPCAKTVGLSELQISHPPAPFSTRRCCRAHPLFFDGSRSGPPEFRKRPRLSWQAGPKRDGLGRSQSCRRELNTPLLIHPPSRILPLWVRGGM